MDANLKSLILGLLETNRDLSLATLREDGFPQANIVSYANDGLVLYFATARASQKIRNIHHCNKVSLTIASPYVEWNQLRALSMAATAYVQADDSFGSARAMELLLARFPTVWDMSPPSERNQNVFVRLVPLVISVLDYTQGFGHTDQVEIEAGDL